jgi:hypothetical protein
VRARGLFLVVGAIPFGCSLLIETDELANEGAQSSTGDASADVSSQPDSSGTGGTKDTGSDSPFASDSSDAAGEADAPVLGFCEGLSPLCSDFDLQNFPAGWDDHSEWGKCKGSIDNSDYTSSPRSFHCTTPVLIDNTDQCSTALIKEFAKPEALLRIEFDVLFDQLDSPNLIHLVTIDTGSTAGTDTTTLRIRTGEGLINETARPKEAGNLYSGHQFPNPPVIGQWSHIVWEIDFTGAKAYSNITVDGDTTGEELHMKPFLGELDIKLGIGFTDGASGPWEIHIDNLVVDVK